MVREKETWTSHRSSSLKSVREGNRCEERNSLESEWEKVPQGLGAIPQKGLSEEKKGRITGAPRLRAVYHGREKALGIRGEEEKSRSSCKNRIPLSPERGEKKGIHRPPH